MMNMKNNNQLKDALDSVVPNQQGEILKIL